MQLLATGILWQRQPPSPHLHLDLCRLLVWFIVSNDWTTDSIGRSRCDICSCMNFIVKLTLGRVSQHALECEHSGRHSTVGTPLIYCRCTGSHACSAQDFRYSLFLVEQRTRGKNENKYAMRQLGAHQPYSLITFAVFDILIIARVPSIICNNSARERAQKGKHIQMYAHNLLSITNRAPTKDLFQRWWHNNSDNGDGGNGSMLGDRRQEKKLPKIWCALSRHHHRTYALRIATWSNKWY